MSKLLPRKHVPELKVKTVNGEEWNVYEKNPEHFIMIVFYRGLHCPICRKYLTELEKSYDEFISQGLGIIAISSDTEVRALETQKKWKLKEVLRSIIGINKSNYPARDEP